MGETRATRETFREAPTAVREATARKDWVEDLAKAGIIVILWVTRRGMRQEGLGKGQNNVARHKINNSRFVRQWESSLYP